MEYRWEYQRRLRQQRGRPSRDWELTPEQFMLLQVYVAVRRLHGKRRMERFEEFVELSAQREAAYRALTAAEQAVADEERREEQGRDTNSTRRETWKRTNGPRARYNLAGIYERDGGTCVWCLGPVSRAYRRPDARSPSLDHIQELSQGGADHSDNIALTHLFCNMDRPPAGRFVSPHYARFRLALRVKRGPDAMPGYPPQAELDAWADGRQWALAEQSAHEAQRHQNPPVPSTPGGQ
ncbi:hypothetical protein ABIA33_007434 [Streptacidiphilus sp. MAP12-16]|uniref:HNH endonuclease n=1 Tax=Streptacidiphilus sp. MAP12-16 TaxID=3156300 RepID=UPI003510E700